jgi:hypothetical protein
MRKSGRWFVAAIVVATIVMSACGSSSKSSSSTASDRASAGHTLNVPAQYPTIQAAVDASQPGDLILVAKGVYHEAVDVTADTTKHTNPHDITIRGVDRNGVILDGQFKLENGIRVLGAAGVVVENMTARNYLSNGFFWTGAQRYRGSYLTAYRNGDYGVYSVDSYTGQFDHDYSSGSPDAGFYIGACFRCDAVISNVVSEYNGLGYSGTNSGGDLYIVNSEFAHNRAGVVPNSGSYELCYPSRETVVAGNSVHDNNYMKGGGISNSLLAQGNGILLAGAVKALIQHNLVYNHARTGIGLVPFPEADANDVPPAKAAWGDPCSAHHTPAPGVPQSQCQKIAVIGPGCVVLWNAQDNKVLDNNISASGLVDMGEATIDLNKSGVTTEKLGNCFSGNTFKTSSPANLEALAPCEGQPTATDWSKNPLDLITLLANTPSAPPKTAYRSTPVPAAQPNMPDAATAPAPVFTKPMKVDAASITTPAKP